MAYEIPKQIFDGNFNEVILGTGARSLVVGGDASYPFHFFEGSLPNQPKFAMEVCDLYPADWAEWAVEPFSDVAGNPIEWAKKCVGFYGAEAICLQLASTDPEKQNRSPEAAANQVREVISSVDVPVIVYGTGNERKDAQVFHQVSRECSGRNLFLGPVLENNVDAISKSAAEFGHGIIIQTPLEINPAREMNIKVREMLPTQRIMYDPFSMAVGYGIEFTFTTMQRVQQGALLVNDESLQMPLFAYVGRESWMTKEARKSNEQGIIMEVVSSIALLLAGANVVVSRHPESFQLLRSITERNTK